MHTISIVMVVVGSTRPSMGPADTKPDLLLGLGVLPNMCRNSIAARPVFRTVEGHTIHSHGNRP